MKTRNTIKSFVTAIIAFAFLCTFSVDAGMAESKTKTIAPTKITPSKQLQLNVLPDLVVDGIALDSDCNLVVKIRNAGPGVIPDSQHSQGVVRVRYGKAQKEFPFMASSVKGIPAVDKEKVLQKAGGVVAFNTDIKITASLKARAYVDYGKKIAESNDENNTSDIVKLAPDCIKSQTTLSQAQLQGKTKIQQPSSTVSRAERTMVKPADKNPPTPPRLIAPVSGVSAMPRVSRAFDLIPYRGMLVVLQGSYFGNGPDGRQIRLVRANTAGDPVMTFFLTVREWSSEEIIADMPDTLVNPSNPAERGTHLSERAGVFKVGLYSRSDNRWLSNQATVEAGTSRDSDADGDGSTAVRYRGDDCDDSDVNRYPGNTEIGDFDGHDEDCNPATIGRRDEDGDGYTDARVWNDPAQFGIETTDLDRYHGDDCDDSRADVHPGQVEVCNGRDDNCDGEIDEGVTTTAYRDEDRDLYGDPSAPVEICYSELRSGLVTNGDDCDDSDPTVNPREGNCP